MTLMQHEREIKEEAREEGREEGYEMGIRGMIKLCLTLEMSNDQIKEKLINVLDMTESEAEQSIYRYVK